MEMAGTFRSFVAAAALFALAIGSAAQAQTTPAPGERRISVVGQGTVRGRPDMAVITAGVVSEAKLASEALAANTAAMTRILDAMRAAGIESRDLQTANFAVEPRYSQPPADFDGSRPFTPEIVGYSVRNDVTIRVRDLRRTGEMLDQVINLGANSVSGPTFAAAEPADLEDQARRAAMRDAIHKGELYAQAAGVKLGRIVLIDETVTQMPPPLPMAAMARESALATPVPIEGGELAFQAQVAVSWAIP
jgi:uncharacterized protein YggE